MKKAKYLIAIAMIAVIALSPVTVAASPNLDTVDMIYADGEMAIAVRDAFEMFGFTVEWEQTTRTVTIVGHDTEIILIIDSNEVLVDGVRVSLPTATRLVNSRTFAPLTEILETIVPPVGVAEAPSPVEHPVVGSVELEANAAAFFTAFFEGDFSAAFSYLGAEMQGLGEEFFESAWENLLISMGSYQSSTIIGRQEVEDHMIFSFEAYHTMGRVIYNVAVGPTGEVNGFVSVDIAFVPLPVNENRGYTAEPITVGAGTNWELDGLLTMPNDASEDSPVPAVVLVHGSGAHNMDSSLFDNRPFYDIADYLSANGIAVLRHNKRNFTHGTMLTEVFGGGFTIWEESVEDALLAAGILRADPRVDNDSIFLLGLSQGAMLAPRIQAAGGDFAGFILMAGSPLNLAELILVQNIMAIEVAEGGERQAMEANLAVLHQVFNLLPLLSDAEARALDLGGMSAYYLRDIITPTFEDLIQDIHVPILVMQGTHDFQVTVDVGYDAFAELLGDRGNVELILYEGLNHVFMTSIATNIGEIFDDYRRPGRVDGQVLRDIVRWVLSQ